MPEQHAVARLEREQLGARRRAPQLYAVDELESEANVKRPLRKGVAADFLSERCAYPETGRRKRNKYM